MAIVFCAVASGCHGTQEQASGLPQTNDGAPASLPNAGTASSQASRSQPSHPDDAVVRPADERIFAGGFRTVGKWVHGSLDGPYQVYYPTGELWISGRMKAGQPVGFVSYYDKHGCLDARTLYLVPGFGLGVEWGNDGTVSGCGCYSEGSKYGTWQLYRPDGSIEALYTYGVAGMLQGWSFTTHANGVMLWCGDHVNGARHGTWREWSENAELVRECEYAQGRVVSERVWNRR